jgi:hypothetical protein
MRALVPLLAVLTLPLAAAPAQADVYKWVDDSGVTHYSDAPPPNKLNKAKVIAEDKLSTYQTDPAVMRSLAQTAAQLHNDNLERRVERLQRELELQRQASQYASADDGMYDSGYGYGGGYYYPYPYAFAPNRGKLAVFVHKKLGQRPGVMPVSHAGVVTVRASSRSAGFSGR